MDLWNNALRASDPTSIIRLLQNYKKRRSPWQTLKNRLIGEHAKSSLSNTNVKQMIDNLLCIFGETMASRLPEEALEDKTICLLKDGYRKVGRGIYNKI